jgi:hypothetical protein
MLELKGLERGELEDLLVGFQMFVGVGIFPPPQLPRRPAGQLREMVAVIEIVVE